MTIIRTTPNTWILEKTYFSRLNMRRIETNVRRDSKEVAKLGQQWTVYFTYQKSKLFEKYTFQDIRIHFKTSRTNLINNKNTSVSNAVGFGSAMVRYMGSNPADDHPARFSQGFSSVAPGKCRDPTFFVPYPDLNRICLKAIYINVVC